MLDSGQLAPNVGQLPTITTPKYDHVDSRVKSQMSCLKDANFWNAG